MAVMCYCYLYCSDCCVLSFEATDFSGGSLSMPGHTVCVRKK
jgi:hypothetical protein